LSRCRFHSRRDGNGRHRFWIEIILASFTGILSVITLAWPEWIEFAFGWDLDQHNGSAEWMITGGLLIVTVAIFAMAAAEWRRTQVAESS
jgi:hypothetical protein